MVFGEQITVSYQIFKSGSSVIFFFNVLNLQRWKGLMVQSKQLILKIVKIKKYVKFESLWPISGIGLL